MWKTDKLLSEIEKAARNTSDKDLQELYAECEKVALELEKYRKLERGGFIKKPDMPSNAPERYSVAIDGPAAAGKSTVSRIIARKKNLLYIDTGAMYRAAALYCIRNHVDVKDWETVNRKLSCIDIRFENIKGTQAMLLNGEPVQDFIRTEEVSRAASDISANPMVRKKLVTLQKEMAKNESVIMEGRDTGTEVLPDAKFKFYMTALIGIRAKRRCLELEKKGIHEDYGSVWKDLVQRDHNDMTREASPLRTADDAIVVDTTSMSIDDAVEFIIGIMERDA